VIEEAGALAERLAALQPELVERTVSRAQRAGRVFIDWVQNDASRSTVAAYSLRATPWPLVSTPLTWPEVEAAVADGRGERLLFGPRQVLDRIQRLGDPFAPTLAGRGHLPSPTDVWPDLANRRETRYNRVPGKGESGGSKGNRNDEH
jgi:bifunctional non-homologous end joining protein LigD